MCNISLGPTRTIEFKRSKLDEHSSASFELNDKSALYMLPGCQRKFVHQLMPSVLACGPRYCLSFRTVSDEVCDKQSTVNTAEAQRYQNGQSKTTPSVEIDDHESRQSKITPPIENNEEDRGIGRDDDQNGVIHHVILSDSLMWRVKLPNTITLCKGGAGPRDLGEFLLENKDKFDPSTVKSVTLCAGTNLVEYDKRVKRFIPMLEVYSDYDHLVRTCMGIFPNAKLILFNVPPRRYIFEYTHDRICLLNFFIRDLEKSYYGRVKFLPLYDEFLYNGYLNPTLYLPDMLHFKKAGIQLVSRVIHRAQQCVADTSY